MHLTSKIYPVLIPFILVSCLLLIDAALVQGVWAQSGVPQARGSGAQGGGNGPDEMRGSFVGRLDKDGDGRVSREEFDGPPDQFDRLDRNHDGYLTEDERPSLPPIAGRSSLPRQEVQVNPSPTPEMQVDLSPTPEVQQSTVAVPQTKEETSPHFWLWVSLILLLAALLMVLLWGLHASRRFKKVRAAVQSLDPHLLGAIRELKIGHEKNPPGIVTVSMGLRIAGPDDNDDIETIYKKADQALYEAKQTGRNRFVVAES